ncbi:MAG: Flp pilus assembly complex ATPase component TadA [Sedimentisphaerales bacterium]|nr:Flp pilus assembly complex ATPase component TadA [Sedimentisphaerales bacterium]
MVVEILGESVPLGGYIAIWKVVLFILLFGLWAWVGQWLDKDAVAVRTKQQFWNNIYLGSGLFAILMWFLLPAPFLVVFLLFLVVWSTVSIVYIVHRNTLVSRERKILTPEHIRMLLSREGKKQIKARLMFISSHNNMLPIPTRQDAEYPGFVTAEDLLFDLTTRRVSLAEISPTGEQYQLRFVIDGVSGNADQRERLDIDAAIAYLKAAGGLDVEDRRKPQKGHFSLLIEKARIDWSIRTAGSTRGEQMVLQRIEEQKTMSIDVLGFNPNQLELIKTVCKQPQGIFLVCGSRGVGQTTTLYSLVRCHDAFIQNVHTLELKALTDLDNITQHIVPASEGTKNGARQLQSILRSDPDVVMVSFCDDPDMAKVGTQAIREGKKLYFGIQAPSTFHGLQAWLKMVDDNRRVSKTLLGVLSQRLMRRLCPDCKVAYQPDAALLKKLNLPADKIKQFFRPGEIEYGKGGKPIVCERCQGTGYFGRMAVFEFLYISDSLRKLIRENAPINAMRAQCRKDKMLYLQEEALRKVIDGTTSIQEVLRVTAESSAKTNDRKPAEAAGEPG